MMRESEVIMTNNDFLRRLRYALNLRDSNTVQIFKKGGLTVTREDVINYLKKILMRVLKNYLIVI